MENRRLIVFDRKNKKFYILIFRQNGDNKFRNNSNCRNLEFNYGEPTSAKFRHILAESESENSVIFFRKLFF